LVKEPVLNHWYRALHSPGGVQIVCSDVNLMRSRLYAARREAQDSDLDKISICGSPFDPMRLWLVKKEPADETP
jgi:hypothetical protein